MRVEKTLLRVIDTAYDLEHAQPSGWLERLLSAARPLLDQNLGCYAWTLVPRGKGLVLGDIATADFSPEQRAAITGAHAAASTKVVVSAYGNVRDKPIATVSEAVGGRDAFRRLKAVREWMHPNGIPDAVGLRVQAGATRLVLGAVLPEVGYDAPGVRLHGRRLLALLRPAFRLHVALRSSDPPVPEAVLAPDGRVVHAESCTKARTAREILSAAVRAHERRFVETPKDPDAALALFEGLVAGRWTLVDRFESDGRRYVVAYENSPRAAAIRALSPREQAVLRWTATGASIKRIAAELGIEAATAAGYLYSARAKTGIASRAELVRWFREAADPDQR